MSWWWLLFGPLLVWIAVEIIKDLLAYLRTLKYKEQGFYHRYEFLVGNLMLRKFDNSTMPEFHASWNKVLSRAGSKPGLVINSIPRGKASIYLTDPSLVHEFLLKDHLVSRRHDFTQENIHYLETFPFKFGVEAENARARFASIFQRDVIGKSTEVLRKQIRDQIKLVETNATKQSIATGHTFTADWKAPTQECLFRIANTVFFGEAGNLVRVKSQENKIFSEALLRYLEGPFRDTLNSQVNKWLCKLPEKLNILKSAREAQQRKQELTSILKTEYLRRTTDSTYVPSWNLIDLKISATNATDAATVESAVEEIFQEAYLYVISGINTTRKSVIGMIYLLALHPDCVDKIYAELCQFGLGKGSKTPITMDLLDSLKYLERFFKESQRYLQGFSESFPRIIVEDFTLGKYKFAKGDTVNIPYTFHFFVDSYWENPVKFDPERFVNGLPKSVPPMAFIPFGAGKRMCTGRILAETVIKAFMIELIQKYTLSLPVGKIEAPYVLENGRPTRENYLVVCTDRN